MNMSQLLQLGTIYAQVQFISDDPLEKQVELESQSLPFNIVFAHNVGRHLTRQAVERAPGPPGLGYRLHVTADFAVFKKTLVELEYAESPLNH